MKPFFKSAIFTCTCIVAAIIPIWLALTLMGEKMSSDDFFANSVFLLSLLSVLLVAWVFPNKRYDTKGNIVGMHASAVRWNLFIMFSTAVRMIFLRDAVEGSHMIYFLLLIVAFATIYYLLMNVVFKKPLTSKI